MPIEAVADLLKQRNSAAGDHMMRTAEAKVEQAMNAGYLTPAMRPWALSLCAQNPDSFESFIATAIPAYAHMHRLSPLHGTALNASGKAIARGDEHALCEQLGLSPEDLK